jgi:transcriptional regulator with GAF, ATPase, and Fis domain
MISRALDGDVVVLGRSSSCDIVLRDPSVSRRHLEIRRDAPGWVVEDLGSSNGSLLNGSPLLHEEILAPGDEIVLGDTSLTFQALASESMPAGMEPPTRRIRIDESDPDKSWQGSALVGRSPAMLSVLEVIDRVAKSDATILITGPNGSGKELVARMIHARSPRREGPFVPVNCPALPGSLLESELFGVEKGVATGVEPRKGRFQMAQGGTLLLDEIGDMSATAQAGILRVLEEKKVEPIGARTPVDLDARILASTNHDLETDIEKGTFRRDLYHRINTVKIELPPLRDRREDTSSPRVPGPP